MFFGLFDKDNHFLASHIANPPGLTDWHPGESALSLSLHPGKTP
jgi:hypothetical protein